jgi:hypothetical protein
MQLKRFVFTCAASLLLVLAPASYAADTPAEATANPAPEAAMAPPADAAANPPADTAATPPPADAQATTMPPPPEQQGAADQPAMAPSDRPADKSTAAGAKDPAAYKRQVGEAEAHARKAELAGNEGNIPEMLRHTKLSLEQAQVAQRAGTNPTLDGGIMDLKQTLAVGQRDLIAPAALQDARIKLSKAASIQTVSTAGMSSKSSSRVLTGELRRSSAISTFPEQEAYVVRDPQSGADTPVFLSPDMTRQVKEGDTIEAQVDPQGRVVAITPKSP